MAGLGYSYQQYNIVSFSSASLSSFDAFILLRLAILARMRWNVSIRVIEGTNSGSGKMAQYIKCSLDKQEDTSLGLDMVAYGCNLMSGEQRQADTWSLLTI